MTVPTNAAFGLAIGIAIWAIAIEAGLRAAKHIRERNPEQRCYCGYAMEGLTQGVCPECGRRLAMIRPLPDARRLLVLIPALAMLLGLYWVWQSGTRIAYLLVTGQDSILPREVWPKETAKRVGLYSALIAVGCGIVWFGATVAMWMKSGRVSRR